MTGHTYMEINEIDGFIKFLLSIDWKDPWLIALIIFHISITFMAVYTRQYGTFQAVLFFCLLLLVYFSEQINEIAANNWKIFSRQQYFDSSGLFISVVFSMPILLNCMLMVGSWLWQSRQLMMRLKLAQLKESIRQREINSRQRPKDD
ncbi:transmembrane protein 18 [Agrilus planipennis]|uniref:Transmembrane protein 18 n=1 Tax=Agrilus planipennis TaxID=224129 RepID=A0A1W4XBD6_AGRPL|nr:transmembrane protein 18 [Agrilus planipennis]